MTARRLRRTAGAPAGDAAAEDGRTRPHRDVVPLGPRLMMLQWLRLGIGGAVGILGWAAPWLLGGAPELVAGTAAAYLVLFTAVEVTRRVGRRLPRPLLGGLLLVDGLFVAWVVGQTGGPGGPLGFLVYLHLVAVTLAVSYRTGLKLALWYALLVVTGYYLQGFGPAADVVLSRDDTALAATTYCGVALLTAAFSALNERELRRSRAGFRALARMGAQLEAARRPEEVVAVALRSVAEHFAAPRVAVVLEAPRTIEVTVLAGGSLTVTREEAGGGVDAVVRRCWEARRPQLVRTLDGDGDPILRAALPGARRLIVVPLLRDGQPHGAMVLEAGGDKGPRGPLRGGRLAATTLSLLGQFAAHTALAHHNARLLAEVDRLATTDALTGVANRRTLERALARETARHERTGEPLTLLMLDIDHFKAVNDTHGHETGDAVLRHLGAVLTACSRDADLVARFGGEEFVVLMPACAGADALEVAQRFSSAVGTGAPLRVTASIGLATLGVHAADGPGLLRAADEALYEAKRTGRNRIVASRRSLADAAAGANALLA